MIINWSLSKIDRDHNFFVEDWKMSNKYNEEVVSPGDKVSKRARDTCVKSYNNNAAIEVIPRQPGNFRGAVDIAWSRHILEMMLSGKMTWNIQNDGAGGKPQFFTMIGTKEVFSRLGWEIIVMVIDDIARSGGFPVVFSNDVNAKSVTNENVHLVDAMFDGMDGILRQSNQVNTTGEFAIMKHSVTAFCDTNSKDQLILNWAGTGVGLSHEDKIIDGSDTRVGMPIVGFFEPGYRCNGGTMFTELILRHWVKKDIANIWENHKAMEFIKKLTIPSKSYAKTICRVNGWLPDGNIQEPLAKLVNNAHITGGGLEKFKEILPSGIGADINNMPKPASVLLDAQILSFGFPDLRMDDKQAHTTFHGGCGWMSVCATIEDAEILIKEATKDGIQAQIIGETIKSEENYLFVKSKFLEEANILI